MFKRLVPIAIGFALVVAACGGASDGASASADDGGDIATTNSSPAEPSTSAAARGGGSSTTAAVATTAGTTEDTPASDPAGRTTPVPVPDLHSDVAIVGCSQTRDAVVGYMAISDRAIFGDRQEVRYLSGGSIEQWSEDEMRYWDEFARWNGSESDALWIQLCYHASRSRNTTVDSVATIIDRAFERIGRDVAVYISGLNDWEPRDMCSRGDYEASWELAEAAVAAGLGLIGPDPGVITRELTDDGCHGNEAGDAFMGEAALDFFG